MKKDLPLVRHARLRSQRGTSLIVSLLLLLVVTVLSVAMFRKVVGEERMAGNVREHQRALAAAQTALQYAENWLSGVYTGNLATCDAGTVAVSSPSVVLVCDKPVYGSASTASAQRAIVTEPSSWATRFTYQPSGMAVGTSDSTTQRHAQLPGFYISALGLGPDGRTPLYQVSSYGIGGNGSTISVVQSTYALTAEVTPLDNP